MHDLTGQPGCRGIDLTLEGEDLIERMQQLSVG